MMASDRKKRAAAQMQRPQDMPPDMAAAMGSFKRGGTVKKTGTYKLHKGERVVPAKKGR